MGAYLDRSLILEVRRELVRRSSIDASQLNVYCVNGVIELSGNFVLTSMAGNVRPREELAKIKEIIMRMRGVRDVIDRYLRVLE